MATDITCEQLSPNPPSPQGKFDKKKFPIISWGEGVEAIHCTDFKRRPEIRYHVLGLAISTRDVLHHQFRETLRRWHQMYRKQSILCQVTQRALRDQAIIKPLPSAGSACSVMCLCLGETIQRSLEWRSSSSSRWTLGLCKGLKRGRSLCSIA